jgi:hypothetical protein
MTSRHYWRSVRRSAIQRMARLVKKNQAIKLNMPTVGNPARFKLLVSKESLLQSRGENNQLIAEFYQPRRFVKDFTN